MDGRMCRIYGHMGGGASPEDLRLTGAALRHGGPDGHYLDEGGGWALGATRLAVMAPDQGAQPYRHGPVRVVFNGEIYNHRALRAQLARDGYHIADRCDGAVLPALYHRYGLSFTEHLDGMYALAVLDLRAEPKLVLSVDESGVKPLYYHRDRQGGLSFASEPGALGILCGAGARLRPEALDTYLTTKTPLGPRTVFTDITAMEPAETLVVTPGRPPRPYRRRAPAVPALPAGSLTEAADGLRSLLRAETGRLAVADAPVAAVLSGGLDSSLVTGLLAREIPGVHCFHIRYRGSWPADESGHARTAARAFGARLHEVVLDPARIPEELPRTVRSLGQPNADPITVSTLALFRAVREAGFTVALTGDAADELFGGYDRTRAAVTAEGDWAGDYVRALAAVPPALRAALYHPEYRALLRGTTTAEQELLRRLRGRDGDRLAALTEIETGLRMPAYHLRRVDHLSMAGAVEVRPPFCQRSVTGAARQLPDHLKVHGGVGKRVLQEAARGLVPESVRTRVKQPFTLPVAAMLTPGTPLFDYAREVLAPSELRLSAPELDPAAVARLLDRQAAAPDATSALAVWSLLVFELWRREAGRPLPGRAPARHGTAIRYGTSGAVRAERAA
ncbi:asparagine synthase (glutamine-hydrolyzing) [Streptomyces physcomitrii]|uniref:asparagine synthase (glutamine-hydrolyzing) n=1 Tax=Streptomyces physcomitrii TaxID=2724184 RepID=UPI0033FA2D1D